MSLNPTAGSTYLRSWNYSNPDVEDYNTEIVGTVLAIQEVQKTVFRSNPPIGEFWPDGNPKMNIRIVLCREDGVCKLFTFQPASKAAREGKKKSIHIDLFALTGNTDMRNLIGKTIRIATQPGQYGANNPRPWTVSVVETGPFAPFEELSAEYKVEKVLTDNSAHGGQTVPPAQYPNGYGMAPQMQMPQAVQPQAQPRIQSQPQPVYQQQYQQPVQQPVYQQQYQQQPVQQMPQMQYPAGMDPQVAAAMQGIGAMNVSPYEDEMPF